MNILVVDDDNLIRTILAAIIKEAGHQPILIGKPEDAIAYANDPEIDLILMDVEMPNINGFQLTRKLRELQKGRWIPIIFLSGRTEERHYEEGIDSGGDDYLTKPISPVVLSAKIKAMERISHMKQALDEANERLKKLSTIDPLTGALNRRGFMPMLEDQWEKSKKENTPLSLLMLDIDHFKLFNDNYGHPAGDGCLQQFYHILKGCFQKPTDLICRFGGEEFIVLLPKTSLEDAQGCAKKLLSHLSIHTIPHEYSLVAKHVTCSIGISERALCDAPEEMIEKADSALYLAKKAGRNRYQSVTSEA